MHLSLHLDTVRDSEDRYLCFSSPNYEFRNTVGQHWDIAHIWRRQFYLEEVDIKKQMLSRTSVLE